MFLREWLQGSRVPISDIAFISAGKEPKPQMGEPEKSRHRQLKYAIEEKSLKSCGELGPFPPEPGKVHGGTLVHFDELVEFAKSKSWDWLDKFLELWKATRAGLPQEELDAMFCSLQPEQASSASDQVGSDMALSTEPEPDVSGSLEEKRTKKSIRGRPPDWPRAVWLECLLGLSLRGEVSLADSQESIAEALASELENVTGKKPSIGTVKKDWLRPILKKAKKGENSSK